MHAKCFVCVCVCQWLYAHACVLLISYILKKKKEFLLQFHFGVISRMGDGSQAGKWNVTVRGHIVYVPFHSETELPIAPPPPHPTHTTPLLWIGATFTFERLRLSRRERGASSRWHQVKREFDGETAARVCEAWLKWFSDEQFIHHLGLKCCILRSVPPDSRWWGFITPANISRRFFDARQRARDDEEFSQFVPWWKVLTRWWFVANQFFFFF